MGHSTPLTTDLLERIARLYRIKEEIRGELPDVRRRCRQERSKPRIDSLHVAIYDALRRLSPKSAMAKALVYGRKRWTALTRFLDERTAEIDNNIADAVEKIASGWSASRWNELMPWNWAAGVAPVSPLAVRKAA